MLSRLYRIIAWIVLILVWFGILKTEGMQEKIFRTNMILAALPLIMWVDTIFIVGFSFVKYIPLLLRIFFRSRRGTFLAAIFVVNYLFWYPPFRENISPYAFYAVLSLGALILLLWLQPPFVFLLGESTVHTGRVLASLSEGLFPLRVVAMLDRRRTSTPASSFSWITDDLRADSERDWWDIVEELLDMVHLVVLDARTQSLAVGGEVERILSKPDLLKKTIFIVGDSGEAPVLSPFQGMTSLAGVHTISEGEVRLLGNREYLRKTIEGWRW